MHRACLPLYYELVELTKFWLVEFAQLLFFIIAIDIIFYICAVYHVDVLD